MIIQIHHPFEVELLNIDNLLCNMSSHKTEKHKTGTVKMQNKKKKNIKKICIKHDTSQR